MSAADQSPPSLPDRAALERLATTSAELPLLSVCLRTDPRDPANTRAAPAWSTALTRGLNDVGERLEADGGRDARLAFRAVRERLLDQAAALTPAELGRSVAWFVALDGSLDERYVSRLPLADHVVRLDARPFVSPLADLAERGAPAGVVLVAHERVRLLAWEHGWIDEAEDLELEIDQSEWRPYRGAASPGRSQHAVTHTERVVAREEAHRDRFFAHAAAAVAERVGQAGWERVVLLGADGLGSRFHVELPEAARRHVQLVLDLNLAAQPAAEVAQRVEPHLEALRREQALALAERLAAGDDASAAGPPEVLTALAERRVGRLLLDPWHEPDVGAVPPVADTVLGGAGPALAGERAVESALAAGARVTALRVGDAPALARADGMLAELRW